MGLEEGSIALVEEREQGVLIRPAVAVPVERYSPEQKAEFLLNNATDEDDYSKARNSVVAMGLDPDKISHRRPSDG